MKTRLICAFPGTGKSYLAKQYPWRMLDYDSSRFSWRTNSEGVKERNPDFPNNYIKHIKSLMEANRYEVIFVSSHSEVRQALKENGIFFTLVYPRLQDKSKYIKRYSDRGNTEDFIKSVSRNWRTWILTLQAEIDGCENIELQSDYIWDMFEHEETV